MQATLTNQRPGRPMAKSGEDAGFWAAVAAGLTVVVGNAVALFLGWRNRNSEDRKSAAELRLKEEDQEHSHEVTLWDRLQTLEKDRDEARNAIWELREKLSDVREKLQAATSENETLRRLNEEREFEYKAKQERADMEIASLRKALSAADEERREMMDEIAGLRSQVEDRSPGWGNAA